VKYTGWDETVRLGLVGMTGLEYLLAVSVLRDGFQGSSEFNPGDSIVFEA